MSETKQICIHHLDGKCRYGNSCTKVHVPDSPELREKIKIKNGAGICIFHPNCRFEESECRKLHIDIPDGSNDRPSVFSFNTRGPDSRPDIRSDSRSDQRNDTRQERVSFPMESKEDQDLFQDFCNYYIKIAEYSTTNPGKLQQIDRIKNLLRGELGILKDTYECLVA
jgi:hypothetical protein